MCLPSPVLIVDHRHLFSFLEIYNKQEQRLIISLSLSRRLHINANTGKQTYTPQLTDFRNPAKYVPIRIQHTANMSDTHTYEFNVSMSCGGCSGAIDRVLKKLDGMSAAQSAYLPLSVPRTYIEPAATTTPSHLPQNCIISTGLLTNAAYVQVSRATKSPSRISLPRSSPRCPTRPSSPRLQRRARRSTRPRLMVSSSPSRFLLLRKRLENI